jgi:mRNA-degrading endonuclease RelE of RelBE toxin-antitoxin system
MGWTVRFTKKASKQTRALPEPIQHRLQALVQDLSTSGPVRGNWKNYGKLSRTEHHCHIKSGRPTYVVCWEVIEHEIHVMEVYYVGTHEGAPY